MAVPWNDALLPVAMAELKRRINELGLTQTQAAAMVGVSQPFFDRILRSHTGISWARLIQMLTALGANIDVSIQYGTQPRGELRFFGTRCSFDDEP